MKFRFSLFVIFCFVAVMSIIPNAQAQPSPGYHLLKKFVLGGEGGWDLLTFDSATHRLYIPRGTHVMVVDADSGAIVGDIPNTPRVHGVAIAPEFGKGFTSNGGDGTVTIFDLKTLKPLGQVKAGKNPDAIIYDSASKRIFCFNGNSNDTTAIDAKTGTVAGTLALGGKPELAVADEHGKIFINLEDKSAIVEFDSRKLAVDATWLLSPGEEPTGIALDRKHHRLFAACGNKLMVVLNAENGKLVTTFPIGSGVDGAGFDSERQLAFSPNGADGTLTVVHENSPDKFTVVENVPSQRGARTMTLDEKSHRVFLATAEFGPTPAATEKQPRPRPPMLPGTFTLLVYGK
ncbi:MAG: YncE family protein [Acidobacteriota bacterium]|nr:YncE family protein [Acidobacteriota bacterium]